MNAITLFKFGIMRLSIDRYNHFVPVISDIAGGRKTRAMASVSCLHFYTLAD